MPNIYALTLPLTDPILKFMLILGIILAAPLLLNRLKIPPLLGLIIAGAVIGPHGFNLVMRDSSIILSGTAGLLYIMFLAGLEMDMNDFRKNSARSLVFGLYTFLIPMALGVLAGIYLLGFSILTSVLLASMFASHTLIAYPIVSKLGVAKDKAVIITVGGTIITDTLALLVLSVVVGMVGGDTGEYFWYWLGGSVVGCTLAVLLIFPYVARWFFKYCEDSVSQYIFVLVLVFLGAYMSQAAGLEAIIGAFLTGMALNRLIPRTSPLMNRVEFVGNAIFIPFFLIGVGMLIDYRSFFTGFETIKVGLVMIAVATAAKFIAAWLTQKTFRLSLDQRRVIFGLSNAQAAATLAAVMVGYNIVVGHNEAGEPIRLLDDSVLNGTILMILVTCTIASFAAQRGAKNLALAEVGSSDDRVPVTERILIPVSNADMVSELVGLSTAIKSPKNRNELYALNVVNNRVSDEKMLKHSRKVLGDAAAVAAATDVYMTELLRYDVSVVNAIISVIKEHRITDLVLGLHKGKDISDTFLGKITEGILSQSDVTTFIYKSVQPIATLRRHLVIIPEQAEKEAGFPLWVQRIWNMISNTGGKAVFYASQATLASLRAIAKKRPLDAEYKEFTNWDDFLILFREIQKDDAVWVVLSRRERISYQAGMTRIPHYLNAYAQSNSFVIVYPVQADEQGSRYLV